MVILNDSSVKGCNVNEIPNSGPVAAPLQDRAGSSGLLPGRKSVLGMLKVPYQRWVTR